MGRTVPSYRMALEFEIDRWKPFRKAIQSRESREAFDGLMDACRNQAMAGSAACNPVLFEPMVMSIFLDQAVRMQAVEERLCDLIWQDICTRIQPEGDKTLIPKQSKGESHA